VTPIRQKMRAVPPTARRVIKGGAPSGSVTRIANRSWRFGAIDRAYRAKVRGGCERNERKIVRNVDPSFAYGVG
jgi:hypothetical protein